MLETFIGFMGVYALAHPEVLPFVLLFNALTDFGDLIAISIPLIKRQAIDRTAWTSAGFALPAGITWLVVRSLAT